jgi:serine/threonine-protein kinase HipA
VNTAIKYLRMVLHQPAGMPREIGYLSQYGDIMRVSFVDSYINDPQRPTLSLAYRGQTDAETRQILSALRDMRLVTQTGRWPAYFSNLLPEGHNRERLARQRSCSVDDEFELLAAAGHDLMGALEVAPVEAQAGIPEQVRHWHTTMGLDVLEPGFVELPVEDGSALPGAVTKFSAIQDGRRYTVRRQGEAGSFILKLPTASHPDLVANEYTCYQLCEAVGLQCAQARIIALADADLPEQVPFDQILAVQRFDRGPNGQRIHMEEFAQALQYLPKHKYGKDMVEDYARMLGILNRYSARPAQDVQEFVNRFVAFVVLGNTDAHLKNWALLYPDGITPQLAPLYDVVSVSSYFAESPLSDYALNRGIDARLQPFGWPELAQLLQRAGVARVGAHVRKAQALVGKMRERWPALLQAAPASLKTTVLARLNGGLALTQA